MRYVPFADGCHVSRLGVGGWQAGGTGPWGAGPRADDDDAIAAIRCAVEGGVTWVDTAASYGLGHSEEVVRRALEPWRVGEEVFVFTKCGHPWLGDDVMTDGRPESIRDECDGSLRRLGVDRLDLLQLHHPDPKVPVEESWGAIVELVAAGKVRWGGVSNVSAEQLERCEAVHHVTSVQPELNLLRRGAAADVVPWALVHGTVVLAYSPLAGGDVLARNGMSAAEAVAWVLSVEGVTGAICGARRPQQVEQWLPAGDTA